MSSLIRWTPFLDPFEDVDKTLRDFMPVFQGERSGFMPAVDMYEDKDNVIVEVQLAGIDPKDVSLAVENNILNIKGESEEKKEVEEKNYYRKEIRRGSFYRSLPLPTRVLGEEAKASAEAGVLKIFIPKAPEVKPKTIKIETKKNN
ncbi:hypothetical protein COX69_00065 [Candidatus Falkowbacteria bacterium CG_4_10_14_0_2_um_filter_48_10]|uniref:SHSP domain-containing protein n=1 Tax=Candidatus Falkowbacteria bacterium CG23_combo_of_CG06-09_8_20_14_all_49_15 TaxID=1974572 RepID=A0A2G9ZNG5_9BACT|nr:MAG: hypothetical protein COX22_00775 [Candidatus Falkowbacteria bacterium CG23_combo_of_CG06-09_8_20_14_all_49_15]PJA09489.1 MAG: hypothetical protein COX69_00065 [Candidatus Falkowbacteria bacterium CG_4_10_14_0_2_um_filter_48_10]